MKKITLIVLSGLGLLLSLTFVLIFTPVGNNILRPIIETKINESSPLKLSLEKFSLSTSQINLLIKIDEENSFLASGTYSLFNQDFDIDYTLKLTQLKNFSDLAKRKLSGALESKGKVKGDLDLFEVKGESDFAKSDTSYALVVKDLKLDKTAIKLKDLDLKTLLVIIGEKAYAKGKLDLHLQASNFKEKKLKGSLVFNLKKANLSAKVIKKEFGLQLLRTSIKSHLKATFDENNLQYLFDMNSGLGKLYAKGKANTQKKSIQSIYKVDIKELALLNSLSGTKLKGPFATQGVIIGDEKELEIKGKTDIAASKSTYDISLKELKPSKIIVHVKNAQLHKLLYMTAQKNLAKANINADIVLNNLDPKALDGTAFIQVSNGQVNTKAMKKAFDIKLPKTTFSFQSKATLKKETINYALLLNSNLAKINSKGQVKTPDLQTQANYRIDIRELALLKPIINAPLRGPFATDGKVKGTKKSMQLTGNSNLANSKTNYIIAFQDLAPKQVNLSIENAQVDKLLYLVGEPSYAKGELNLNINLSSVEPLNGKVILSIHKGIANAKIIERNFETKLPYTSFNLRSDAKIRDDILTAKTKFNSNLAKMSMEKTDLNLKTSALKTDYKIAVPSLIKLEPILERKLYGKFTANGNIIQDKKLTITAFSKIFKGKFNAKIIDDDIKVDFKDLRALEILKMLDYPQVIDAPLDGTLVYNTTTQKGKLDSKFDRAMLQNSKMTKLIQGVSGKDLTKEHFNKGSLISLINKEIINSKLDMQSTDVKLKSKKFIINSKKQLIDARFALKVKKYPGDVLVKGNINAPEVKVDLESMVTPEVKDKVSKEINRFLKKLF